MWENFIDSGLARNLNAFTNCLIYLQNFQGLDYSMEHLQQPLMSLRYTFSYLSWKPIPIAINIRNETETELFLFSNQSNVLLDLMPLYLIAGKHKGICCETTVYLHPPPATDTPSFFFTHKFSPVPVLRSLFIIQCYFSNEFCDQRFRVLYSTVSTVPNYALVALPQPQLSLSSSAYTGTMSALLYQTKYPRVAHTILTWATNTNQLQINCEYSDYCNLISWRRLGNLHIPERRHLDRYKINCMKEDISVNHWSSSLVPRSMLNSYHEYKSMKYVITKTTPENILRSGKPAVMLHMLNLFLPDNVTLHHYYVIDYVTLLKRDAFACMGSKEVSLYPAYSTLSIDRSYGEHYANFAAASMVVERNRLRFVSCHESKPGIVTNLLELVHFVDSLSWVAVLVSVALAIVTLDMRRDFATRRWRRAELSLDILKILVDQGCHLYGRSLKKITNSSMCVLGMLLIPLCIFAVHYRGDNITRLTVSPPLVPYDTFDDLVKNGFRTFVSLIHLRKDEEHRKPLTDRLYFQRNNHDAYPMVSSLWEAIQLRFTAHERLEDLGNKISARMWYYLNNTQMFPSWSTIRLDGNMMSSFHQLIRAHLMACVKVAVVMREDNAIQHFHQLQNEQKAAFMGKDIMHEILLGHYFTGQIHKKMLNRIYSLPASGLRNWWWKYLDEMRARVGNRISGTVAKIEDNGMTVFIPIFVVLAVGLVVSFVSFIIVDIKFRPTFTFELLNS